MICRITTHSREKVFPIRVCLWTYFSDLVQTRGHVWETKRLWKERWYQIKKLLNFKCITWQDKQIQQQNKNTLSYVFLSPCHLITISSIEHKNRPITGKNLRLALKYGTLHRDTLLLLLLVLSRHCLLADEMFFTPSSAKRKKKVNILRNIIQELKANTWNKREARENAGDLVEICFSFSSDWLRKWRCFFFQTNHKSRSSSNNAIPKHFSLPIGKLFHL